MWKQSRLDGQLRCWFDLKQKVGTDEQDKIVFGQSGGTNGDIVINDDVRIYERVNVLLGSHIGQGAIIATETVVSGQIPPYAIVSRVPAKVIKFCFWKSVILQLLKADFKNR